MGEGESKLNKDNSKSEAKPSLFTGSLIWLALEPPLNGMNLVTGVAAFVGLKDHQVPLLNQVRMRASVRSWERFVSNAMFSCSVSQAVWGRQELIIFSLDC